MVGSMDAMRVTKVETKKDARTIGRKWVQLC